MTTAPKKNRGWIWYFVVLFVMAIVATTVLVVFNLRQQLTPEQLEAARQMWKEKGPRDYSMTYTIRKNAEPDADQYEVKVRGGRTVESRFNGQPESPERFGYRTMDALFNDIERFMKHDSEKGSPKVYVRAIFDVQKTGGIRWYVRRVMGGRQRQEITVERFTID